MKPPMFGYYCVCARRAGVPDLWLEDAAGDMTLALWRDGKERDRTAILREAIDAARRYGWHRREYVRPHLVALDEARNVSFMPAFLARLELRAVVRALGRLSPRQRRAMARRLRGEPMRNIDTPHVRRARQRLRQAVA